MLCFSLQEVQVTLSKDNSNGLLFSLLCLPLEAVAVYGHVSIAKLNPWDCYGFSPAE